MTLTPEHALALRKPFPPESVGKLPKGPVMLDYVGHAAVTDRLLTVDPEWSWEPMALDQFGSPMLDKDGNLWIRLTICGMTRIGVGDGKNMKERVGDALRNAAMRFGVALDLWAKENLVEFAQAQQRPTQAERPVQPAAPEPWPADSPLLDTSSPLAKAMFAAMGNAGIKGDDAHAFMSETTGRPITSSKELTELDTRACLKRLDTIAKGGAA